MIECVSCKKQNGSMIPACIQCGNRLFFSTEPNEKVIDPGELWISHKTVWVEDTENDVHQLPNQSRGATRNVIQVPAQAPCRVLRKDKYVYCQLDSRSPNEVVELWEPPHWATYKVILPPMRLHFDVELRTLLGEDFDFFETAEALVGELRRLILASKNPNIVRVKVRNSNL